MLANHLIIPYWTLQQTVPSEEGVNLLIKTWIGELLAGYMRWIFAA